MLTFAFALVSCKPRPGSTSESESPLGPPTPEAALAGLPRDRPFPVSLVTDAGTIRCSVDPRPAPRAVALFIGFASGRARFLDPKTHAVSRRPLYRNLPFTRGVRAVLIQSGDLVGDGSGQPGYRIEVEGSSEDAARLTKPGALVLAPYRAPPGRIDPAPPPTGHVLGSQFAVLLTDMHHLAGKVSVLGHCDELTVARRIADEVAERRPHTLLRVELH